MKAVRVHAYGGPDVLTYEGVSTPEPAAGEARIRIEAIGVNFVDVYYRTGKYPSALPMIPGMEAAGVVEAVSQAHPDVVPGARVAFAMHLGSYAEFVVLPVDRLVPIPDDVPATLAAASLLQGMTAQFLGTDLGPERSGEPVLVHAAAGGLGQLLVQVLKKRGMQVLGTASTSEKRDLAASLGADLMIDYTRDGWADEVMRFTDGRGVAVVYDSVGAATWKQSFDCVRSRGSVVFCGQSSGMVPPIDPQLLRQRGSVSMSRPSLTHYIADRRELLDRVEKVYDAVRRGELRVRIEDHLPLKDAAQGHVLLESRTVTGKIILSP